MTSTLAEPQTFKLTEKQKEARKLIGSIATYILLYGGSRSAKTFKIVRAIVVRAILAPNSRHAILRFRFNKVKTAVVFDTFPKVMELCFPDCWYHLDKQDWFVKFSNGSEIWFGGLDDKERTEKILGHEYVTIFVNECSQVAYNSILLLITRLAQKCLYTIEGVTKEMRLKFLVDENPPNMGHWSYKLFLKKVDPTNKQPLPDPENYGSLMMNPGDNIENLPGTYISALQKLPKRQKDRFYHGKFADENENALWTDEIINKNRVNTVPDGVRMVRVVVAVDPSGASDDENENNDDIGIGVAGLGADGLGYVFEDLTIKAGPATWGKVAASAYQRHLADRVVGEANFGGAMVEFVVKTADPNISYKSVTASRGKVIRAEPVSALHEVGKIKFVGRFDELEDELLGFTTTGYTGEKSPNRADWFIWAITELFPGLTREPKVEPEEVTVPRKKRI